MTAPVSKPANATREAPQLTERNLARFAVKLAAARDGAGEDDCWLWRGQVSGRGGYGVFSISQRVRHYAHRIAFYIATGEWPTDRAVMHSCDRVLCVNRRHLRAGTWADNSADRDAKGRTSRGSMLSCSKLTEALVSISRERYRDGERIRVLAAEAGVSYPTMRDCLYGRTWTHVAWPEGLTPRCEKTSIEIRRRLGLHDGPFLAPRHEQRRASGEVA